MWTVLRVQKAQKVWGREDGDGDGDGNRDRRESYVVSAVWSVI